MNRLRHLWIAFVILTCSVDTQAQNINTTIKVQAMQMAKAFIGNDFKSFVQSIHPAVIKSLGGEQQLKAGMDSAHNAMKKFGVRFKRYWIGDPAKIISYKNQLQTVVPQSTTLSTPFGEIITDNALIVISDDGGKHWRFVDTSMYQLSQFKSLLNLSPELIIPPVKKPRMVPASGKKN